MRVGLAMKLVFSRKGFDSASGGFPSPIVEGVPVSLPIPAKRRSHTTYADLGLGTLVEHVTGRRLTGANLCHCDPMFENGRCAFGQIAAAQSHLANNGVSVGDVFLFFGLFSELDGSDRHHRIFGFLRVEERFLLGVDPGPAAQPSGFAIRHPHTIGRWPRNNCLYVGRGLKAATATDDLRLSRPGGPVSRWRVPGWLRRVGLTYHGRSDRWQGGDSLRTVGRGQEFVADISRHDEARTWLEDVIDLIGQSAALGRRAGVFRQPDSKPGSNAASR
ncbi:MAG: hypothetical protein OXP09_05440 [Gammaproteobacteria bacterium]|nr:hypothetical protein [Gammaproteobacteria bacterium]MDE0365001.1 hypothetical protein [Gammaproteobacteria bacterium]